MTFKPIRIFLGLFLAVAVLVAITRLLLSPATLAPRVLPVPNGYDDFRSAGNALVYPGDFSLTNLLELRSQLATNAESLHLIRQGLTKDCMVPWESWTNYFGRHLNELGKIKALARLLHAEARLAELEQRTNDAAKISVEIIRYSQMICRGGRMIDRLVGIACEDIGSRSLQRVVGGLDALQCREAVRTLEETLARRESAESVLRAETAWMRANASVINPRLSLIERIQRLIPISRFNPVKRSQDGFVLKMKTTELAMTHLVIRLAARAFELEKGRPPARLEELVPQYLSASPVDPSTGKADGFPLPSASK